MKKPKHHFKKHEVRTNNRGDKSWYYNGVVHREGKPAIEYANGTKEWIIHGVYHRLDGPAREFSDGTKIWYIDGERLTEDQFNEKLKEVYKEWDIIKNLG